MWRSAKSLKISIRECEEILIAALKLPQFSRCPGFSPTASSNQSASGPNSAARMASRLCGPELTMPCAVGPRGSSQFHAIEVRTAKGSRHRRANEDAVSGGKCKARAQCSLPCFLMRKKRFPLAIRAHVSFFSFVSIPSDRNAANSGETASIFTGDSRQLDCAMYLSGGPGVAGGADGGGVMGLMATDAATHRGHAGVLGHDLELGDVTVTHRAPHAGLQMCAVRPCDAGSHLVDTHPGNRLIGFFEVGELHNRRPVFRNARVAHHAGARGRKSHLATGIGIGMAGLASQALSDV